MNNKLRIVIIAQLVFFTAWAGWLFSFSSRTKAEFCLDTLPVDPRDILSGTYLALRYEITSPKGAGCDTAMARRRDNVYVQLGPTGRKLAAGGQELDIYGAQACSEEKPPEDGKIWVRGRRQGRWRGMELLYGIEKFFVNENDKRKDWTSGKYAVRVKADALGNLRLVDLVEKPGMTPEPERSVPVGGNLSF